MTTPERSVLIYLDDTQPAPDVADAPPITDVAESRRGATMRMAAHLATRRPSRPARWFRWSLAALTAAAVSVAVWDFVNSTLARSPILGWIVTGLVAVLLASLLVQAVHEAVAFGRLSRIDRLRHAAGAARAEHDPGAAGALVDRLVGVYASREETGWGRGRLTEARGDILDTATLMDLAETELLGPLDRMARQEVEAAARQVATVTALVPLALADVAAALTVNLRMIRRVAEVYGGRSGVLASWRLTRAVLTHLVATGAVAVGEDLLEPVLGGYILAKLSGRIGEGLVNGALTARVGLAAMDICRPLPFVALHRPSVRGIVKDALSGLVSGGKS